MPEWLKERFAKPCSRKRVVGSNPTPSASERLCFGNHYSLDGISITKKRICNNLGIDILIEDSIEYALECMNDKRSVFLLDCLWNQRSDLPQSIKRYMNWDEIAEAV